MVQQPSHEKRAKRVPATDAKGREVRNGREKIYQKGAERYAGPDVVAADDEGRNRQASGRPYRRDVTAGIRNSEPSFACNEVQNGQGHDVPQRAGKRALFNGWQSASLRHARKT